jgi:hypothetical protein
LHTPFEHSDITKLNEGEKEKEGKGREKLDLLKFRED